VELEFRHGQLWLDGVTLNAVAEEVGTPAYVYSRSRIESNWRSYKRAFDARGHRLCYAVKANDNLSVLQLLVRQGAGFDIVSGGELERVLTVGADPALIVFSGVGKSAAEIERALQCGVGCLNVESAAELARVADIAERIGKTARFAIRVNPDIDPGTHPYIATGLKESKFGVPFPQARKLYAEALEHPWLSACGVACHIGSQLTSIAPMIEAVREVVHLAVELSSLGHPISHVDVGGGLGIRYADEHPPPVETLVEAVIKEVPEQFEIHMEPGRSVVGNAGVLLARVEYVKRSEAKNFVVVDAAMNDLLRPALYQAWHEVLRCSAAGPAEQAELCDVVGPVCESGDWLAQDRHLVATEGDLLAFSCAGAYGFVMSSNYNARPRPVEVLVEGDTFRIVRQRESVSDLMKSERELLRS
jgi:diaminopimelate decarboxylase